VEGRRERPNAIVRRVYEPAYLERTKENNDAPDVGLGMFGLDFVNRWQQKQLME
jgi:hypothetical protein